MFCKQDDDSVNGDNGDILNDNKREDDNDNEHSDKPPKWFNAHTHKTQLLQYRSSSYHAALNADIQDFISSLFWILESKRVEATRDTSDKIPLLCAPFERKDFVGLDMESRNNRKRVLGRLKKHLGDLSLQAGLLAEAWNYYNVAVDVLRPANDWLWLAASLEGLCAVSVCLQEQSRAGGDRGSSGRCDGSAGGGGGGRRVRRKGRRRAHHIALRPLTGWSDSGALHRQQAQYDLARLPRAGLHSTCSDVGLHFRDLVSLA